MAISSTTWKPGISGNPAGRPRRGTALSELLREKLDDIRDGTARRDQLADKLIDLALSGNLSAIALLLDRIEGKPEQKLYTGQIDSAEVIASISSLLNDTEEGDQEGEESPTEQ